MHHFMSAVTKDIPSEMEWAVTAAPGQPWQTKYSMFQPVPPGTCRSFTTMTIEWRFIRHDGAMHRLYQPGPVYIPHDGVKIFSGGLLTALL